MIHVKKTIHKTAGKKQHIAQSVQANLDPGDRMGLGSDGISSCPGSPAHSIEQSLLGPPFSGIFTPSLVPSCPFNTLGLVLADG